MKNVTRLSRFMCVFTWAVLIMVPVVVAVFWWRIEALPSNTVSHNLPIHYYVPSYSPLVKLLGFIISLLPASIVMFAVYQLNQFFQRCKAGVIFSVANVKTLNYLGYCMLAWVPIGWLYDGLISLLLSSNKLAFDNEWIVEVTLKHGDIFTLLCAGTLIITAFILKEAADIYQDHQLVI